MTRTPIPASRLVRLDARLKLLLLLAACFLTQYLPNLLLLPWLGLLTSLFAARRMRGERVTGMLRGGVWFTLFWLVMKILSDLLAGSTGPAAVATALPLAGRLVALTAIGAAFSGLASPLEIGRALTWFLAPAAGERAWKPALVVALAAWFLPQSLRLLDEVFSAIRARGLDRLPWRRKALVAAGAAIRILLRKADELALGLAARRLDDSRSWHMGNRFGASRRGKKNA